MEELQAGQLTWSHRDKEVSIRGDHPGVGGVLTSVCHDVSGTRLVLLVNLASTQPQEIIVQVSFETPVFVTQ